MDSPDVIHRKYIPITASTTPIHTLIPAFLPTASPRIGTIRIYNAVINPAFSRRCIFVFQSVAWELPSIRKKSTTNTTNDKCFLFVQLLFLVIPPFFSSYPIHKSPESIRFHQVILLAQLNVERTNIVHPMHFVQQMQLPK